MSAPVNGECHGVRRPGLTGLDGGMPRCRPRVENIGEGVRSSELTVDKPDEIEILIKEIDQFSRLFARDFGR
ncbi:hypothetical protein [Schaalia cardiffensis]|uniref:hypothetical protein n=1 Tax=Schaalia cardiffensis TaxID=181487 RepID=UPI002AB0C7F5|nr:hypothetical protein [Schaalia cardiffensis]